AFLARQDNKTWEGSMNELWQSAGLASHAADPTRLSRHINKHIDDLERNNIAIIKKRRKTGVHIHLNWVNF
ncbi:hypothetical protein, partial [Eubacterium aggregans]|uniref:hypothetical protein n=1 Tax=Eubacterium aggregans TaxID=81409 RepID=UPI003F2A949D